MERMDKIEERLRSGMCERGITGMAQDAIVKQITSFALYGFPESHSASFALIAYASAYLKAHHPTAFYAALLNAWPMGFYHPATLLKDAERRGVEARPIDVNLSGWKCRWEPNAGSRAGSGVGAELASALPAIPHPRGHPTGEQASCPPTPRSNRVRTLGGSVPGVGAALSRVRPAGSRVIAVAPEARQELASARPGSYRNDPPLAALSLPTGAAGHAGVDVGHPAVGA
jgi:hypothetical protein